MLYQPPRQRDRLPAPPAAVGVPVRFNIGTAAVDRWAAVEPGRVAVLDLHGARPATATYGELRDRSDRLALALRRLGVAAGDRVAVFLPQGAAAIVAQVALYKLGAIVLPLAAVFGPEALAYRFADAGVSLAVTDARGAARIAAIAPAPTTLRDVVSVDGRDGAVLGLDDLLDRETGPFVPVDSASADPALMIYTSGTTGQPKGALHGHRVLAGHLPGLRFSHGGFPQPDDLMWTPADWAWAGGLLNAVLPALYHGVPVVARRGEGFDADGVFRLLRHHPVTRAFIPPTALRMLRAAAPEGCGPLRLRSVTAAGEALGAETRDWARGALGCAVEDVYGQTECNYVLGSASARGAVRRGAIGRATPGHTVAVLRPDGTRCEPGEPGGIAVRRPDPTLFLGYWNRPEATAAKFIGDWMTTGDQATMDRDGYVSFLGRDDDIITSSGFRIGPVEIEECLLRHPAVAAAAVVGQPDALRTEIVKAFVVLRDGVAPSADMAEAIQRFVRQHLSAHEYPRAVDFVAALPMTTTGKVMRGVLRGRG
ncbi:AMP-binding protein [Lichenibacterium ramalinae]|uniref:AMP-dependent synthetase n=1 Tax=Lichenibacterium ramalinae TaxID=2316527 RepID=A0A4Q2RFK2_9HYPH|nr:AMP-binding protein [Lichenibacterium ramalinae]RYB06049.1 AMP-dependent synthetase [Lichenibacterium ramalinae]